MGSNQNAEPRLIHEITLSNLLSFSEPATLKLQNLNVLIGPNGAGKSNLLEVIALIRSTPHDLRVVISNGGGTSEWIWKGKPDASASIDIVVDYPEGQQSLRHFFSFRTEDQVFRIEDERIENEQSSVSDGGPDFYYRLQHGVPELNVTGGTQRTLSSKKIVATAPILAQIRDPIAYPEITHLSSVYKRICLYREWSFGRNTIFRQPQRADLQNDRLEEDFSNLGLFLNRLRRKPAAKNALLSSLRDLYEELTDFDVSVEGGTVQVFFTEGNITVPATRLSDGSLRYLCLLAILCDPEPPQLIGIEEPELGLHPDLLPKLADLLISASKRTQLIVTTHSDILVDALTERPETVVVCEKHNGATEMKRLDREELAVWLEKYRLGQLWTRGQLGGTRW